MNEYIPNGDQSEVGVEANDLHVVRRDGRRIVSLMRDAPPFDEAGHYDGAVADVSDLIAYGAAFERERKFIASLLDNVKWPLIVLNTAGRIVLFNPACEKLTGYAFGEIKGRPFWDVLLAPEARAEARLAFDGLGGGRFPATYENEWIAKDGGRRWIAWSNTAIRGAEGQVELLIGSGFDITERRRVEEARLRSEEDLRRRCDRLEETTKRRIRELEEAAAELIRMEDRYRTVAGFTYDWEYWEGSEGNLRYVSPSCARITGYRAEEFIADPSLLHRIILPEDRARWERHRQELASAADEIRIEFRIRRRDGAVAWIRHTCRRVTDAAGRDSGVRASNHDITEAKRLEEESDRLRYDLTHAARVSVMGELTTSLAHELNQPLTAIMTNATAARRLLDGQEPDVAEARAALVDIVSCNRRASDVIRRIRAMSRKEAAAVVAVDLNDLVRDVIALLRSDLLIKGISIRLYLPEGLPCALGDRVQIQQVLLNLITNAADAMHGHPGARELGIRTTQTGPATLTVSVDDTGPGLTSDQLDRIFTPFFTTKGTGMGMGLAISRSIAEAHGGQLRAENKAEGGAVFHFSLPVGEQRRP